MPREKTPIRASLNTFVGADRRQAGEAVSADTWIIRAAFTVDGENGLPRYVITEISARQVGMFLRALPTAVAAEVTGVDQEHFMRAAGMSETTIAYVRGKDQTDTPQGVPAGINPRKETG
jgi:hypothetical protein